MANKADDSDFKMTATAFKRPYDNQFNENMTGNKKSKMDDSDSKKSSSSVEDGAIPEDLLTDVVNWQSWSKPEHVEKPAVIPRIKPISFIIAKLPPLLYTNLKTYGKNLEKLLPCEKFMLDPSLHNKKLCPLGGSTKYINLDLYVNIASVVSSNDSMPTKLHMKIVYKERSEEKNVALIGFCHNSETKVVKQQILSAAPEFFNYYISKTDAAENEYIELSYLYNNISHIIFILSAIFGEKCLKTNKPLFYIDGSDFLPIMLLCEKYGIANESKTLETILKYFTNLFRYEINSFQEYMIIIINSDLHHIYNMRDIVVELFIILLMEFDIPKWLCNVDEQSRLGWMINYLSEIDPIRVDMQIRVGDNHDSRIIPEVDRNKYMSLYARVWSSYQRVTKHLNEFIRRVQKTYDKFQILDERFYKFSMFSYKYLCKLPHMFYKFIINDTDDASVNIDYENIDVYSDKFIEKRLTFVDPNIYIIDEILKHYKLTYQATASDT
jgi:hypothetical protein